MMKKICALALCLAMILSFAAAEETPGYEIVYSAANPIPEIAERVRPAVVQVLCFEETWDAVTRIAATNEIAAGSGCYIRSDAEGGYILTNNHIVENGEVFKIQWLSGEEMDAELLGADDGTDIAVLRFAETAPSGVSPHPDGRFRQFTHRRAGHLHRQSWRQPGSIARHGHRRHHIRP